MLIINTCFKNSWKLYFRKWLIFREMREASVSLEHWCKNERSQTVWAVWRSSSPRETTRRWEEPWTTVFFIVERFKVESRSRFVEHLEGCDTMWRKQVARLKRGSTWWFNGGFEKLLEAGKTAVCKWKDYKSGQVEDAGSKSWQLMCLVKSMIDKSLNSIKMLIGKCLQYNRK